jgi:hypothetical protein
MTAAFLAATHLQQLGVEQQLPGYKPEWTMDLSQLYGRSLSAQRTVNGVISTSEVREELN